MGEKLSKACKCGNPREKEIEYAIKAFNKRWEEFDVNLYLLAYFLHPRFRGKYKLLLF